ncbi:MAG: GntR family transcriptional regulator, partial [Propioniciclava sp.]
ITSGAIPPGRLLEDEVSLAKRLEVSRPTARRALQDLVGRGLLTRRRGAGTRVTPTHVHRPIALTSLNDDLRAAGYTTRTDVLSYEVILAGEEEADLLKCPMGSELVKIERLRWADEDPLGLMSNLIPVDVAPSLTDLVSKGLYQGFTERSVHLASADQVVGARPASDRERELLEIEDHSSVLTIERTSYDSTGRVVEYGKHAYTADRYTVRLTLVAEASQSV